MTGLQKIVAAIQQEAQAQAQAMIDQAHAEAARIQTEEAVESDAICARIESAAKQQAAGIERAAASAAQLQRRRQLLETKQQLIAQTVAQALQKLYALPQDEYFALLIQMAVAYAQPHAGELLLNERDLQRCPADFAQRLAQALPAGAQLTVLAVPRPIDGGMILKYGDIEHNCSFRAILDARREELTDTVRAILFA